MYRLKKTGCFLLFLLIITVSMPLAAFAGRFLRSSNPIEGSYIVKFRDQTIQAEVSYEMSGKDSALNSKLYHQLE